MAKRLVRVTLFSEEMETLSADKVKAFLSKTCPAWEQTELKVLPVTTGYYETHVASDKNGKNVKLVDDDVLKQLEDAEILVTEPWFVFPCMDKFPNLKWVQSTWAGIDGVYRCCDKDKLPPPFMFTRLGGALAHQMAEYVMTYILGIERNVIEFHELQKTQTWKMNNTHRQCEDITVGILGVGDIGSEVARVVKAFGMKTWGLVNRDVPEDQRSKDIDEYRLISGLPELLANCDYLCNVLPSTTKTKGLLSGDVLSQCKKKPVFINIGRGDITTEDTIINAIKNGWISKAVLDVFNQEPLPKDNPLWNMPEVIITPHCSGVSFGHSVMDVFAENFNRYMSGQPLKYLIKDWERGY